MLRLKGALICNKLPTSGCLTKKTLSGTGGKTLFYPEGPKGQRFSLADTSNTLRCSEQAIKTISDFSLRGTEKNKNSEVVRQV